MEHQQLQHMVEEVHKNKRHIGIIAAVNGYSSKISEKCAIPDFRAPKAYELPENCGDDFRQLIEEYIYFALLLERSHMIVIRFQLRVPQFVYHLGKFQATIKMKQFISLN